MERIEDEQHSEYQEIFDQISSIGKSTVEPSEFWPTFLETTSRLVGATLAVLLVRQKEGGSWKQFAAWAHDKKAVSLVKPLNGRIEAVAEATNDRRSVVEESPEPVPAAADGLLMGIRLEINEEQSSVAVYLVGAHTTVAAEEALLRLTLVADTPALYQLGRMVRQAKRDVVGFASALDLMALLNEEKRYMAAAMTFCNEISSRYQCDRVSLGWLKGAYVRVQAVSQLERFEKKMNVVQNLEAAMEEAFDQDEEIVWPPPGGSQFVARDHEQFVKETGAENMISLPLRLEDRPVAVLSCERGGKPFSEEEIWGLRVLCDQSTRRLADLKHNDRWFGAKAASALRDFFSKLVGVEHTFAKMLGVVLCVALAALLFGKMEYRVEAPVILKTDQLAYLPAPFDGFIKQVEVKVGDRVETDEVLLTLNTRELLLEESNAIANQIRYQREAEKSRAQNALADMRVALSLEEQAKARLKLVRFRLEHSRLRAPFSGVVVEGDLQELMGSPVRKGDVLLKIAKIEKMYAELKVSEKDIHELKQERPGEIALVSRPDLKFPIRVQRIDPVAIAEEEGNVFLVRADFPEQVQSWWRPGMSGVAKVNAGKRSILWIVTHRTVDFLRMLLWW